MTRQLIVTGTLMIVSALLGAGVKSVIAGDASPTMKTATIRGANLTGADLGGGNVFGPLQERRIKAIEDRLTALEKSSQPK